MDRQQLFYGFWGLDSYKGFGIWFWKAAAGLKFITFFRTDLQMEIMCLCFILEEVFPSICVWNEWLMNFRSIQAPDIS